MFGFNELSTPVKAIISLAFVLLLVVVAGLILRRITGGRLKFPGQGARARQPRLGIVDVFEMDRQRQLVLLRRDNVEHLVMIGGPNDLVIEASIVRSARAQVPIAAEPVDMPLQPEPHQPAVAAPEPAAAPPPRAAPAALPARPQPSEQATVPAAAAMAAAAAAVAGQALASTATPRPASAPTAPTGTLPATAPARTAATDDFVASLEAEMARDMAARTAPIQAVTSPGTPAATPAATPPLATPPLATPAKPILEPIATPASARASQVELDEMTRQLQEALARPFSGVKPGAASPEAPATAEEDSKVKDATPPKKQAESETAVAAPQPVGVAKPEPLAADLDREMQAAMSASLLPDEKIEQRTAETVVKPRDAIAALKAADAAAPAKPPEPTQESMQQSTQEAAKQDAAPAPVAAKPEPAKPAQPAPAAPETQPARAGAPQRQDTESREQKPEGESVADEKPAEPKEATAPASSGTGPDPFSVDAIEAEFARLLNRSATPKT